MNFEIAPKELEISTKWEPAKFYCFSLGDGWRLPTGEELTAIHESENDFSKGWYWSSDIYKREALTVNFGNNEGVGYSHIDVYESLVRPVRDLKDNS